MDYFKKEVDEFEILILEESCNFRIYQLCLDNYIPECVYKFTAEDWMSMIDGYKKECNDEEK